MTGPTTTWPTLPGAIAIQPAILPSEQHASPADTGIEPTVLTGINAALYKQLCTTMTAARPCGLLFPEKLQRAPIKGWLLAIEGSLNFASWSMTESVKAAYDLRFDLAGTVQANAWQTPSPETPLANLADLVVRQGTYARMWAYFHNACIEAVSNIRKKARSLGLEALRERVEGNHTPIDEELTDAWSASDLSIAHLAALDAFDKRVLDSLAEKDATLMKHWRRTKPFMDVVGSLPAISWNC